MTDVRERLLPAEIEITPAMIKAGVAIFRSWEEGVDYNGGFFSNPIDVESLVRQLFFFQKSVGVVC